MIKGFIAQGGDITIGDGTGGESVFGAPILHENYLLKHNRKNLLSMANDTPGCECYTSQFFINFEPMPWLDGKNVVIGEVIEGLGVLKQIEDIAIGVNEVLKKQIIISASGELPL